MQSLRELLQYYAKELPGITPDEVQHLLHKEDFTDAELQLLDQWLTKVIAKEQQELRYEQQVLESVKILEKNEAGILARTLEGLLTLPRMIVDGLYKVAQGSVKNQDDAAMAALRKTLQ